MDSNDIAVRHDGPVFRIELNRPDCGNLVTMGMVQSLAAAFRSAPCDAKLIVVAGRGADFCKGRDYQSAQGGRAPTAQQAVKQFLKAAPLMEPRGRAEFGASLFAKVLSSR